MSSFTNQIQAEEARSIQMQKSATRAVDRQYLMSDDNNSNNSAECVGQIASQLYSRGYTHITLEEIGKYCSKE